MTSRFVRPVTGFFLGFWLLTLVLFRSQAFNDPGALWHIRVGDIVLERGLPHTDPFTWAYADRAWVPQQWLAECGLSVAHHAGGFDTMLLLMATLLAALGASIAKRFTDSGLHWTLAALFTGLGLAVAAFHFYLRPHLATIVLMAVVMALLVDFENGRAGMRCWIWLIPLCAIWTNLHGGVLGGIATAGMAVAGWSLFFLLKRESPLRSWRDIGMLALILAACGLATLANPFGLDMHRMWWEIIGSHELKQVISEHQPLNLSHTDGQSVAAFGLFYVVMLAGTLPRRPRVAWLIPLVWFALTCTSIRHGPLFCVTALVALADFFPHTLWFRMLKKHGDTLVQEPPAESSDWRAWLVPAFAVLAALGLQVAGMHMPVIGSGWAQLSPRHHPVEFSEILSDYAKSKPRDYPIFNDANLGGFIVYHAPTLKVFMDDRCELYGDAGIRDYIDMAGKHPERIREWLQRAPRPIEWLLVQPDTPMARWLAEQPGEFREIARCNTAILFEVIGAS